MKKLIILLLIPILMQGQTTLEKFKARQDSVMKANRERIERLNDKRDSTWYEKGMSATDYYRLGITSTRINYTIAEIPEASFVFAKDSARVTVSGSTYKTDLGIYQTMVLATIVQMWDSYAKECKDTLFYDLRNGSWFENEKGELCLKAIVKSEKKNFVGFIEFLRNKLKEN